jgi:ketosteroid isomerase-like protein
MRRWWAGTGLALATAAAACARPDPEAMRSALMAADRAFAEATAQRGAEGWTSWFAEDARQFHQRGVSIGKAEIRRAMEAALADTTRRLVWHPLYAEVAGSADLGYTVGRWEVRARARDGTWAAAGAGSYVTIWRRQADRGWKVAVDIGNEDRAAEPAGDR